MSFMDSNSAKWGYWGAGCLLDVVVFFVALAVLDINSGASFLLYMIMLALPMAVVRHFLFSDATPRWQRICLGPAGALACLALAAYFPLDIPSDSEDPAEGQESVEAPVQANGGGESAAPKETVEEVLAELDSLVGLEGVKEEVRRIVNLAKVNEARRAQGLKVPPMTYHMVFTGNPGTGKTTVARIVARAFRALGIAKGGQLVETDRSGLVGRYAGETAVKTNEKVDEAIGGILFVDEAYQLASSESDDYGKEAIATLLKRMEDDRDRLIVIAAGYTDEMRDFLDANSGLRSRFSKTIEFADYTAGELAAIFRSMAKKNEFALAPDLDAGLDAAMAKLTAKRDRTFGNARFVRQLFEDATGRQANRLAESGDLGEESLKTLTLADLGLGEKKADVRAPTVEEVLAELDALVRPFKAALDVCVVDEVDGCVDVVGAEVERPHDVGAHALDELAHSLLAAGFHLYDVPLGLPCVHGRPRFHLAVGAMRRARRWRWFWPPLRMAESSPRKRRIQPLATCMNPRIGVAHRRKICGAAIPLKAAHCGGPTDARRGPIEMSYEFLAYLFLLTTM